MLLSLDKGLRPFPGERAVMLGAPFDQGHIRRTVDELLESPASNKK